MATRSIRMIPRDGESWRTIATAPNYMVSDRGRVARRGGTFAAPFDRILEGGIKDTGYRVVMLSVDGKVYSRPVHQLVAETFIRLRVPGDVVNHLDGNKMHNRIENLEITDHAGNVAHAVAHGLIRSGIRHGMAKLTDADVREIRRRFTAGESGQSIADAFGITRSYAYNVNAMRERASA